MNMPHKPNHSLNEIPQNYLNVISDFLRNSFHNIASIALVGSYGIGEGKFTIEENKINLFNDLDLYVIHKSFEPLDLQEVIDGLQAELNNCGQLFSKTFQKKITLDLHTLSIEKLENLPPTIRFFDLKHASNIIFGENILNSIPDFEPHHLPCYEGFRLLLNRLYYSCEWFSLKHLQNEPLTDEVKHEIQRNTIKNYIIAYQALLILCKKYDPRISNCAGELKSQISGQYPKFFNKHTGLFDRMAHFINLDPYDAKNTFSADTWFTSLADLLTIIFFYQKQSVGMGGWDNFYHATCREHLSPYLKSAIQNKIDIPLPDPLLYACTLPIQIVQRLIWLKTVFKKNDTIYWAGLKDYRDPTVAIYTSILFLFLSIKRDGAINKEYFDKSINYLKNVYPNSSHAVDEPMSGHFDELLKNCQNAFDLRFKKGPTIGNQFIKTILRVIE